MGFGGYRDPIEAKAAREAAEKMAEQQQFEDSRTEALCTAIVEGFGLLAQAILAAAGKSALGLPGPGGEEDLPDVCCQSPALCGAEPGTCEGAPSAPSEAAEVPDAGAEPWQEPQAEPADAELDGLLDHGGQAPE